MVCPKIFHHSELILITKTCSRCSHTFTAKARLEKKSGTYILRCKNSFCDFGFCEAQALRQENLTESEPKIQQSANKNKKDVQKEMAIHVLLNPTTEQNPVQREAGEPSNAFRPFSAPIEGVDSHLAPSSTGTFARITRPENQSALLAEREISDQSVQQNMARCVESAKMGSLDAMIEYCTMEAMINDIASISAEPSDIISDIQMLEEVAQAQEEAEEGLVNLFDYFDANPVGGPACGIIRRPRQQMILPQNLPAVFSNEETPSFVNQGMELEDLMCSEEEKDLDSVSGSISSFDLDSDSDSGPDVGFAVASGLGPDPGSELDPENTPTAPLHDLQGLLMDITSMDATLDRLDMFDPEGFVSTTGIIPVQLDHDPMEGNTDAKIQGVIREEKVRLPFHSDYWNHSL